MSPDVTLPVFPLASTRPPDALVDRLLAAEGLSHADTARESLLAFAAGPRQLTIDLASGAIWSAVPSRLWKARFSHREPQRGDDALFDGPADVIPGPFWAPFRALGVASRLVRTGVSATRATRVTLQPGRRMPRERHVIVLDSHHSYTSELQVPDPDNPSESIWVPLTGPGVRLGVTHDLQGRVIALHRSVPYSDAAPVWSPVIPRHVSVKALRKSFAHLDLQGDVRTTLAFEMLDACTGRYLRPVWAHAATARIGQTVYDLPIVALPATEFEAPESNGGSAPGSAPDSGSAAHGGPDVPSPAPGGRRLAAGGWWGDERLPHARADVQAFVRHMRAANVQVVSSETGPARRADWLENASAGVESADLAFFAGHATFRGWAFQDQQELAFTHLWHGDGASLFGRDRLKWIAVAGCGPLQDRVIDAASGGNAIRRWWQAFSGLHTLCGFATQIGDRSGVGERFGQLLQTETVIDAWFRAARERQLSGSVYAAALYASREGEDDPLADRLGPTPQVASGSREPDTFTAIWTPA